MVKNYILDTNTLIHDPEAYKSFQDNNVIIPFPVIEEIDKLKTRRDKVGEAARTVNRMFDKMRKEGSLNTGIKLENGGCLRVVAFETKETGSLPSYLSRGTDDIILRYAQVIKKRDDTIPTIMVSKDLNLRIKADALGLEAQDYQNDKVDLSKLYRGYIILEKDIKIKENFTPEELSIPQAEIYPNVYLQLNEDNYYRYDPLKKIFVPLTVNYDNQFYGIYAKNVEQLFAFDALLNPDIPLVSLVGKAGTGKTLLSIAAGLEMILEDKRYKKMLVSKPVIPMGKDIGFLPGSMEDKMKPWLQPVYDNLEFLFEGKGKKPEEYLGKREVLEIEVLSYIRGRSIPNQYMIIDESQNLTPHEIKTIITRVGEGTKIILTGDPYQIDNPYLDTSSNGLVYVAWKFRNSEYAAHVTMQKGERSNLATLAAEIL